MQIVFLIKLKQISDHISYSPTTQTPNKNLIKDTKTCGCFGLTHDTMLQPFVFFQIITTSRTNT